ncbi:hypothetical protein PVAP13_2KG375726 [Panicum virgatum]|uniref:F-box domain-containing protein n=1 Tax=Panicum virgatum TaxID=38727 RepID=A0A8T0W8B0_PANVG|nr:hypothetical protein PVAP13_2KG375726 [Panicum virgatum]
MALNPGQTHQQPEEDVISKLMDDVLLSILEKVSLTTLVRVSALSRRWRRLPPLLTQLSIDVKDFLRKPYADPAVDDHIDRAMLSLRDAARSVLAPGSRRCAVSRLRISLFVTSSYSSEVGHLVNGAMENGMVEGIELTSGVERIPFDVSSEETARHADSVNGFFAKYPSIPCHLRTLRLYNATFTEADMHNLIGNACTQLRYRYLFQCDTGPRKSFRIDAPSSALSKLEFFSCHSKQVEIACLPKLELLISGYWSSPYLPLTLGDVPCLEEVEIFCSAESYQGPFKLSGLLCHTRINRLTLDFLGQKVWLRPEKHQLRSAFSNLSGLSLAGIFVGFGLLWIVALLEVAPALEILHIEVDDHTCRDEKQMLETFGERTNGSWEVSESATRFPLMKELLLEGFNATEEHVAFVGTIMERASSLQSVILKEQYCQKCAAMGESLTQFRYPKNEDEKVAVVNKFRNRFSSRAEIIFSDHKFSK